MGVQSLSWRSAFLQGLGVLLGILIAFGIDAAWDTRQDEERASNYLDALGSELETNRERYEGYLRELAAGVAEDAAGIRDIVFADGAVTSGQILEWQTGGAASFMTLPERAALTDILSSGGITLIDDPAVRRLISRYAEKLDRQLLAQEDLVGLWRGRLVEYYERHSSIYDMVGGVPWYDEGLPVGLGSFELDVDAFVGNRDFANLLAHRSILAGEARRTTNELLAAIDELLTALAAAV